MKTLTKPASLKLLIPAVGALAAMLRILLYLEGTDSKGLLVRGHWAAAAVWTLTAFAGILLLLGCRNVRPSRRSYPATAGLGCLACAAGFVLTGLSARHSITNLMDLLSCGMCFLSAAALVFLSFFRFLKKQPPFLFHVILCITFALRMVCQYRAWNSEPQLMDYVFYMTAHVALMLASYQMACFDIGSGSHRKLFFYGMSAVYLCLMSIFLSGHPLFMLGCGIWALTNLNAPQTRPRVTPAPEAPQEGG